MRWYILSTDWISADVYLFIKTYPVLSRTYKVLICTAAIWEKNDGSYQLIRMYPVPFDFYKSHYEGLKKFTKIRVEIKKSNEKLKRSDSYKVRFERFRILDDSLAYKGRQLTDDIWRARNSIVKEVMYDSVEQLEELKEKEKISLGVIKPREIYDFTMTPKELVGNKWERELLNDTQKTLDFFNTGKSYGEIRPIEHIPYRFGYQFKCDNYRCKGHNMMCEDWELLQLWRGIRDYYHNKKGIDLTHEEIFEKVKQKYLDEFTNKYHAYFVMGTESRWNKWIIIGVYYTPIPI